MPRRAPELTLPADGTCSFCAKSRHETRALVGSSSNANVRICDTCLGLCCTVLAEMAGVLERTPACSAAELPDDVLADIMATLAAKGPSMRPVPNPEFRCSFCDATRPDDVLVFVSGPRVFICNACTGDAVAAVKRAL